MSYAIVILICILIIYGLQALFYYQQFHPKIGTTVHKENISIGIRNVYVDYNLDIPCWGGSPGYSLPSGLNVPDVKWTPIDAGAGWKFLTIELELACDDGEAGLINGYLEDENGANIHVYRPDCEMAKNSTYSNSDRIVNARDLKIIHLIYKMPVASVSSEFHYSIARKPSQGNEMQYIDGIIYLQR